MTWCRTRQAKFVCNMVNQLCICTNHDILLKHSTCTPCYTSLKVVSCEEVTTSCCVGCVQTWVSSRSCPKGGEERERREKRRTKVRRERKVGGKRGENGVSKGREYTTWLVLSNRKSNWIKWAHLPVSVWLVLIQSPTVLQCGPRRLSPVVAPLPTSHNSSQELQRESGWTAQ